MSLKRRIVIAGLGSIGRRHARLLAERSDLDVEWCEPFADALKLAKNQLKEPAKVHVSFDEMVKTQPEMVLIATPHACHTAQACAALKAGIHVLCEKPLSDTLANAQAIVNAKKESPALFTVGFHLHFHPALRRIHTLIHQGHLGSVHHIHCHVGTYITLVNSLSRYQRDLEGALFLDYAHQPDILFWLLGKAPAGVYVSGGQGGSLPFQSSPNFVAINCDYAEPLISTIHLNYLQAPERHTYEVVGDKGWITFNLNSGELQIGRQESNACETERFSPERDSFYQGEHQAFLDAIDGKRKPESPAEDALVSMKVIAAATESLRCGARVPLP